MSADVPASSRDSADMIQRPGVSVVVPFAGSDAELAALRGRLEAIAQAPGDEIIVSDNRDHPLRTPAYARNRGAEQASGEWLVFVDADTSPAPGLLDAYFDPPPAPETAVLAGGIRDTAADGAGIVSRYVVARQHLAHEQTLRRPGTPYAQTANCAVRRTAFQAAGGFEATARAGEDADLCLRLYRAGWRLEERPEALVMHRARAGLAAWLAQLLIHGSGLRWLEGRWPEEFPRPPMRSFGLRVARHLANAVRDLARGRPGPAAFSLLDAVGAFAFAAGRLLPNRRHLDRHSRGERSAKLRG